ncbi:hypothetical protein WA158_005409 [Blastocystis sp. Blastoise]
MGSLISLEPNKIIDNLYIGSLENAKTPAILKEYDIKCIINLSETEYPLSDSSIDRYNFTIDPCTTLTPLTYFHDVFEKMNYYISKQQNVLIHCFYGRLRSACMATAYIIWSKKLTVDDAFEIVHSHRPMCGLTVENKAFLTNLYDEYINHKVIQNDWADYDKYTFMYVLKDDKDIFECRGLLLGVQGSGIHYGKWNRPDTTPGYYQYMVDIYLNPKFVHVNDFKQDIQSKLAPFCSEMSFSKA